MPMTLVRPAAPLLAGLLVLSLAAAASAEIGAGGRFGSAFSSFLGGPALVGDFQIVTEGGRAFLEFGAGFKARSAPDLKVFLSDRAPGEITGGNATDGSVRLGLLMEFEGSQRYAIPRGTDLGKYSTVIVHCEQYSKLWGTGALQ